MEEILLAIGSVVTLKGRTGKVMITGYLNFDNNNGLVVKDYEGCAFPFGTTFNQNVSFNINEIDSVIYEGYKDESFDSLFRMISAFKGNKNVAEPPKFAFDDNGVVVADYAADTVQNPFVYSGKTETREEVSADPSNWSIFNHIEFDANGNVVSAVENESVPESDRMASPTVIVNNNQAPAQNNSLFKFDENGVVVSDGTVNAPVQSNSPFKFDENGVVVSDGTVSAPAQSNSPFKFDENGVVVSDGTVNAPVQSNSPFKFDENGVVVSDGTASENVELKPVSPFKFDENGVVTEDNNI